MADDGSGSGLERSREWSDPRQAGVVRFFRERAAAASRRRPPRPCAVCAGLGELVLVHEGTPFAVRCVACGN
ncbi:hypothetical protein BLA24_14945 [Streptomyces cinnamoneus]|uniref:Uncharacterized protein n=1 Tax=Streptomyces cinnamoneus TaxID=53446 RepID=A0A2G1XIM2_STRCJ|nr:hypothetical protein [Streptomyces cinnamoneus]PHQ51073.1 hypothetical protein BLA24_14945 [Streptomyces cinnamoneus]PPT13704.1 hypothetical protein CYQ11_13125 [Streptomyces cinnamoneus]